MKALNKTIVLKNRKDFYLKHLSIVFSILPIVVTPKELECIASIMSVDSETPLNTEGRIKVKQLMGGISDGGLGNYIRDLKNKGLLKVNPEGNLFVVPLLYPTNDKEQVYNFKIQLQDE